MSNLNPYSKVYMAPVNLTDFPGVVKAADYDEEQTLAGGINYKKFIILDGKRYFVKYPYSVLHEADKRLISELMIPILARTLKIDCLEQKILIDDKDQRIGVISQDLGEHFLLDKILYTMPKNVDELLKKLGQVCEHEGYSLNEEKMRKQLNRLICFDYLTSQGDRHLGNIAVKIVENNGKKEMVLCPLFDNELAFIPNGRKGGICVNDENIPFIGEQKLLNGEYRDILNFFEECFSDKVFNDLVSYFNSTFGTNYLIDSKEFFLQMKEKVEEKIYFCKLRESGLSLAPSKLGAYLAIQAHKDEWIDDSAKKKHLFYEIRLWLSNEKGANYQNYLKNKNGEFPLTSREFIYNAEAREIENSLSESELKAQQKLFDEKVLRAKLALLSEAMNKNFYLDEENFISAFVFLDDTSLAIPNSVIREKGMINLLLTSYKDMYFDVRNHYKSSQNAEIKEFLDEYLKFFNDFMKNNANLLNESNKNDIKNINEDNL